MMKTSDFEIVSTRQRRIAGLAEQMPQKALTSLNHHLDMHWMREAYRLTRKDGATGVDGQTAADYEANLEENLGSLLERAKSGTYFAPPVRRVSIPKGDGKETRAIGIPTFEDKVLQRAVVMALEPIYEQDFHSCSYGFRPGRSAHQALESLWQQCMDMDGGWILEVDIRQFFDTLDHGQLRAFLQRRVQDGVLLRLIGKWLNAGVLEEGRLTHPESGTPQGGVISPLLSNVFLHYVLDDWFVKAVRPRMAGDVYLIRYADDAVMGFAREDDARKILDVLPKRFGKYGLTLHPEKTRLSKFTRPPRGKDRSGLPPEAKPGTFDLLGFTHYWDKSQRGNWVVKRKTISSRFTRALRTVARWCRANRHLPIEEQHKTLSQKLRGHYAYYGITGNFRALSDFCWQVGRAWHKWLSRRRRKGGIPWPQFNRLLKRYPLPRAEVVHSVYRLAAKP